MQQDVEVIGSEYLTFNLGDEDYGVDILRVQEIRGWEMVTRVPNQPAFVKGVLNLRGSIVPIFDLRERMGMPAREYDKATVVIILKVICEISERSVGIVVDGVSDVLNARSQDIAATPDFGENLDTEFITGMASSNGKMVMLLDVDKLQPSVAQADEDVEVA
ncbi:MAG: chemotaxis protein CheW [Chromatiales bacterium]|nr:chemotaxis protein CheW [Chromatiales bacterium]